MSQKLAWLKAVHADRDLSPAAKNVAVALFMRHNAKTGLCCVTQGYLGEAVGLERRRVNKVVGELKAAKWITAEQTLGASYYVLHVEKAVASPTTTSEVSQIEDSVGDTPCVGSDAAYVSDPRQMVSPIVLTEQSSSVSENSLSFRTPAGAQGRTQKSASGGTRKKPTRTTQRQEIGTPLPANLELNDHRQQIASAAGVEITDQRGVFLHFTEHARAHGWVRADWNAAWSVWCRNKAERRTADEAREKPKVNKRLNPWG